MSETPCSQAQGRRQRFFEELALPDYEAYLDALRGPAELEAVQAAPRTEPEKAPLREADPPAPQPRVVRVRAGEGQASAARAAAAPAAVPLLVLDVAGGPKLRQVTEGRYTLGCDPRCTAVLRGDAEVSPRHAEIVFRGGRYLLLDLGSPNGTWLNGSRIHGAEPLASGDCITLGRTEVRVYF